MQNNTFTSETQQTQPNAIKWLSEGLQEYNQQAIDTDAQTIADTIGQSARNVRKYLKGEVGDFNTGSIILTELRKLIKAREQQVKKLVA
jgi:hypothetical protein